MTHGPSSPPLDYSGAFNEHGESPKSLKWASYKAAAQRYRQLVADLDIAGKTILDAGCGMGDLLPYLYGKTSKFTYLGVDIAPEFIDVARKRYEGHRFEVGDPFSDQLSVRFDIVIASGVMNSSATGWLEERKRMIRQLFKLTNEAASFNMAGGLMESSEVKNIAYANSADIFDFCSTLTSKLILRNHYHSKDFTIVMFK